MAVRVMMLWLLVLMGAFVASMTIPEIERRSAGSYANDAISNYLSGKFAWIEDMGFAAMAGGFGYLCATVADPVARGAFGAMAIGLWIVMLTRRFQTPLFGSHWETIHVCFAGLIFLAGGALMFEHSPWYVAFMYPAVAGLLYAMKTPGATQEKVAVGFIALWMIGYACGYWQLPVY